MPNCEAERLRCNDFLFAIVFDTDPKTRRDYMPGWQRFRRGHAKTEPWPEIRPLAMMRETGSVGERLQVHGRPEARDRFEGAFGSDLHFQPACDFEKRLRVFYVRRVNAPSLTDSLSCRALLTTDTDATSIVSSSW